jgi:23S rRNA G2445 N2-methylase RlmL
VRDLDALIGMLGDDRHMTSAERALARAGGAALERLSAHLETARPPLRARIVRAVGRVAVGATNDAVARMLVEMLQDDDPKTRRNAAIALGRARISSAEDALVDAYGREARPEMRRSVAATLGKIGTQRSIELLREASAAGDAELRRIAGRALAMVERTLSRGAPSEIDLDCAPPHRLAVLVATRRGLEKIVAEELAGVHAVTDVRVEGPGRVLAQLGGPLRELFRARTMVGIAFLVQGQPILPGMTQADALAVAVSSPVARVVFSTWATRPVRYRIAWAEGGHRRAATWNAAEAIARTDRELINDPIRSPWELQVSARDEFIDLAIVPRALRDPRFGWRRRTVPASSHPTVAAALARIAGAREDDVVWDPFVGSAAELIERALLGRYRRLLGTDVDDRALEAARENLDAAGTPAQLERADAIGHAPEGVTLIITNPPMGRRSLRAPGLAQTLDRFVERAAQVLAPGGRLVWTAPFPQRARAAGDRAGLALEWATSVDMGGFEAELQRWRKPS